MSVCDEYRFYARDCLELAKGSQDQQSKAVLLGMAQAWIRLADQVAALQDLNQMAADQKVSDQARVASSAGREQAT